MIGDANISEVATYLMVGTTTLLLDMIEDGVFRPNLILQFRAFDERVESLVRRMHLTAGLGEVEGRPSARCGAVSLDGQLPVGMESRS